MKNIVFFFRLSISIAIVAATVILLLQPLFLVEINTLLCLPHPLMILRRHIVVQQRHYYFVEAFSLFGTTNTRNSMSMIGSGCHRTSSTCCGFSSLCSMNRSKKCSSQLYQTNASSSSSQEEDDDILKQDTTIKETNNNNDESSKTSEQDQNQNIESLGSRQEPALIENDDNECEAENMYTTNQKKDDHNESKRIKTDTTTVTTTSTTNSLSSSSSSSSNALMYQQQQQQTSLQSPKRKKMELAWCDSEGCRSTSIREHVTGPNNSIAFDGPATGQVTYRWKTPLIQKNNKTEEPGEKPIRNDKRNSETEEELLSVLVLVKRDDEELMGFASTVIQQMTQTLGLQVLVSLEMAAKLKHYYHVDNPLIKLYERVRHQEFGAFDQSTRPAPSSASPSFVTPVSPSLSSSSSSSPWTNQDEDNRDKTNNNKRHPHHHQKQPIPDLVCTLGGDGLLMYASSLFPGAVPPILCIAGGSLGFLTPFSRHEMLDAIQLALGIDSTMTDANVSTDEDEGDTTTPSQFCSVFPGPLATTKHLSQYQSMNGYNHDYNHDAQQPSQSSYTPSTNSYNNGHRNGYQICVNMRMRLDCRVINRDGIVTARYNVLNEVVIDRGSSSYLAQLECFCDNVHLTTVQADGIIFSTPTGSTAYSMAAGGSVVHPAVPAILVTPICPHVLSFRPMMFPDHVIIRCYVPNDARNVASVAFDGKHHRSLMRGDCVQVQMSYHPVPTINKVDQTFDWLDSLKRNFNFNARVHQKPL